jgi:glucokinase-like ROK family protein
MYSIGIDIGGMSAKIGLVQEKTILQEQRISTSSDLDYDVFVDQLCQIITAWQKDYPVEKVGISSCGLIDRAKGVIAHSNNIRWEHKSIVSDLYRRTGLPADIANDAKCAALAEAVLGAGRDYSRVCMITLGTGVGGGFVCNKQLPSGDAYADAEGILGHITVENKGRPCTCGRKGCLEAYASATAIMQTYYEKTGCRVTAYEIFQRAKAGEMAAVETVEHFCYYLGEGLASLVNVLRPDVIVLGGGVAGSADQFIPYLEETVNQSAFGGAILPVRIVAAELGNAAGILGATLL